MSSSLRELTGDEILSLTFNSRLVALRWDLVPFSLAWDLDVYLTEGDGVPMHRAWICFSGLGGFSWNLDDARLPTGCWLTSVFETKQLDDQMTEYRVVGLFSPFNGTQSAELKHSQEIVVSAQSILGVISTDSQIPTAYGLDVRARRLLASEGDFFEFANQRCAL